MATTTAAFTNISEALAEVLADGLAGALRVYPYVSDAVRPPAVVLAQPTVDYLDTLGGFCAATWTYPLTIVVPRNQDREAQAALSTFLQLVTTILAAGTAPGIQDIAPVDARPGTATVAGADLPAYFLNVRVRA